MKNNFSKHRDVAFGEFVRNTRLELKIGLREFATKIGLSPTFISKMEVGEFKPPKEENIKKIAMILNIDKDELLAKAGRVSSDLQDIISEQPKLYASLLRRAKKAKPQNLEKLLNDLD